MARKIPELKELRKIAKKLEIKTVKKDLVKLFEEILDVIEKGYGSGEFKADHELVVWFNENVSEGDDSGETRSDPDPEPVSAADKKKQTVADKKKVVVNKKKQTVSKGKMTPKEKAVEAKKKKAEEKEVKKERKKVRGGGGGKTTNREGTAFWEDALVLIQKTKKGIGFDDLLVKLQNKWPEKNEVSLRNTIAYLKIKGIGIKRINNMYIT